MSAGAPLRDNPLRVLDLGPECTRAELERAAAKLLALAAVGAARGATYTTPLGTAERTEDKVRAAAAALRDPARRLRAELWFGGEPMPEAPARGGWDGALSAVGLGPGGER